MTLGQPLSNIDPAEDDKARWRENIQSLIAANERISSELRKGASLIIPRSMSSSLQQRLGDGASNRLLEHYTQITAAALPGRIIADNPYLTNILPLAFSDDKVLHSILALSGVHLAYKSVELEYESRSHYAAAIRGVKEGLVKWKSMDPSALLALLTSMLSLCMCEVCSVCLAHQNLCTDFIAKIFVSRLSMVTQAELHFTTYERAEKSCSSSSQWCRMLVRHAFWTFLPSNMHSSP